MNSISSLKAWFLGKKIDILIDNKEFIKFKIDHTKNPRSELLSFLSNKKFYLLSRGSNIGVKEYIVSINKMEWI